MSGTVPYSVDSCRRPANGSVIVGKPVRFCHATAAQPQSQHGKQGKAIVPDISELSPHLQQQWHPDNNAWLGGIKVRPHSGKRVKWSCPNCPLGRPHIWETTVQLRTSGSKCPYCLNKRVCKHNSLATKAPKQWKYWNHEKNAKTPEQVNAGSSLRAHWKCPACRLTWQAPVSARSRRDAGCPSCCCDHKHSLEYRKTTPRRVTFFEGYRPPKDDEWNLVKPPPPNPLVMFCVGHRPDWKRRKPKSYGILEHYSLSHGTW